MLLIIIAFEIASKAVTKCSFLKMVGNVVFQLRVKLDPGKPVSQRLEPVKTHSFETGMPV